MKKDDYDIASLNSVRVGEQVETEVTQTAAIAAMFYSALVDGDVPEALARELTVQHMEFRYEAIIIMGTISKKA